MEVTEALGRGARRPLFLTAGDEVWLWRRRRGCHVFITGKGPEKEEENDGALSGIISHLTAKCGSNVHDRGVVEITASCTQKWCAPRNVADFGDRNSWFLSENKPGEWICCDFKTLRIGPTHYTLRAGHGFHLKSWAVEGSNDGASWTEIDRHENNSDLNAYGTVKTFAVARSGSVHMIRLRQTGPSHSNHVGTNGLLLSAFEVFGAIAGLQ
jgi:hypothetical protein